MEGEQRSLSAADEALLNQLQGQADQTLADQIEQEDLAFSALQEACGATASRVEYVTGRRK